jgi:hypothetical protein
MSSSPVQTPATTPSPAPPPPQFDREVCLNFLDRIMPEADFACTELRVWRAGWDRHGTGLVPLDRYASTFAAWYDRADMLATDACMLKRLSAYITINPVRRDLMLRATEMKKADATTKEVDIKVVRWFYVDIDSVRPQGISATDVELTRAIELRDQILDDHGWRGHALWGCSGNGGWILVRVEDRPADDTTKSWATRWLRALDRRYKSPSVVVDLQTASPSHLMPLPGTVKYKGAASAERPWRPVTWDGGDVAV